MSTLPWTSLDWWLHSDGGLAARLVIGGSILAGLAIHDLLRNRRAATRWREYAFLVAAMLLAVAYGVGNDLITSRISWEYYYYGKGLSDALGPRTPPEPAALAWGAAKVGAQAAWSAGAIAGVALLLANNPRRGRPQLPYRRLLRLLLSIVLVALPCAIAFGLIGYRGGLAWISSDLRGIVQDDLFRPRRFLAVFGVHFGAYVGGVLGIAWAVWRIQAERTSLARRAIA